MMYTTVTRLLETARYVKAHPDARIKADWCTVWNAAEFWRWFHRCLAAKINRDDRRVGRKMSDEYQRDQALDARVINDYVGRRARRAGMGILRTSEMRRRYPGINDQP